MESLCFLQSSSSPEISPAGFQSQTFWGFIFPVQDPQAGGPSVELRPLAPWGEPLWLWYSSCLWFADPGVWVLDIPYLCPSYLSSLCSWLWKIFSASLQVVLMDSCSVSSYNFGVPMGRAEFRVFLLCHLGEDSWQGFSFSYHLVYCLVDIVSTQQLFNEQTHSGEFEGICRILDSSAFYQKLNYEFIKRW